MLSSFLYSELTLTDQRNAENKDDKKLSVEDIQKFVIKYLFTKQNFHKSKIPFFCEFSLLRKDIFVCKGTWQIFGVFY